MAEAVERSPRRDATAADVQSLVQLGRADPPPIPAPSIQPFREPNIPPPVDDETE